MRTILVVLAATALAFVGTAPSAAAATYTDTISGYEYYATSTEGRFAGSSGSGALPGYWNADVVHDPLCLSCPTTAEITGGSFTLATILNGLYTVVTGTFTGGTVQVTDPGAGCADQLFTVSGVLGNVGPGGSGSFAATLEHYRHLVLGTCVTYAASVTGSISLTF